MASHEQPFCIQAGPDGLEALIVNFPRGEPSLAETKAISASAFRKWRCVLCGFVYDETLGLPEEGIPAGTRWAEGPAYFPAGRYLLSASKSGFVDTSYGAKRPGRPGTPLQVADGEVSDRP